MSAPGEPSHRLPVLDDGHHRRITYLRISLTDRCNYRCTYCMPEEGVKLVPRDEVLSFEEIARLVRVLSAVGVRRVRLTGGEPTVRHGLVDLVAQLHADGLDDLAMTTNGHLLSELAQPLRRAGLRRLNISLDSLRPDRFQRITRWGKLDRVLDGISAVEAAGFVGTKINVVAVAGFNDDEVTDLASFAWKRHIVPRYIEWMPMGEGSIFAPGQFLSAQTIRAQLEAAFGPLAPDDAGDLPGAGPARYLRTTTGERVGIISPVTEPFCETCNRMRLSATGQLHSCLASNEVVDLRGPLRDGASDAKILQFVRAAAAEKAQSHAFSTCGGGGPRKHMVVIGG